MSKEGTYLIEIERHYVATIEVDADSERQAIRYAHSDDVVHTIVLKAAKDYMNECSGMAYEAIDAVIDEEFSLPETDINENLLRE